MTTPLTIFNIVLAFLIFGMNGYLWSPGPRYFFHSLLVLSEIAITVGITMDVIHIYLRVTNRPLTYGVCGVAFVLCCVLAVCTSYAVYAFTRRKVCK